MLEIRLMKSQPFKSAVSALLVMMGLSACGDGSSNSSTSISQAPTSLTVVRESLGRACIPIAADGNQALASSALGLNIDTTMLDLDGAGPSLPSISIRNYIAANEPALGGRGVEAVRTASVGYFRSVTAFSLYVCDAMAAMNHSLLQNLDNLAISVFGAALFAVEVTELDELKQSIASAGGTSRQQIVSQCAALLSSFETQCVQ
jgi:hypothetical protein